MDELIEKKKEATIRDFLNVVFRRKVLIISIVLIATLVVVYLNARQPTVYESRSRVLIKRGERANIFSGSVRYLPWEEDVSSQLELILSDVVFSRAKKMLADSIAAGHPQYSSRFRGGNVRAEVLGESNVFAISYIDPDPVFAQLACAAVTQSFTEYYKRKSAPPSLGDYFASQMKDIRTELDFWRNKKKEFLNNEMFFGSETEGRYLLNRLSNLESQLNQIRADVSSQELNVENLRILMSLSPDELESKLSISTGSYYMQSGIITNIKLSLQSLRLRKEELLSKYTPKHPQVIAIEKQIKDLQAQLKNEVTNFYNLEVSKLVDIKGQEKYIKDEMQKINAQINKIPEKDTELQKIENKIAMLQDKLQTLMNKQDEADITLASTPSWHVTVLSPASKAYPKKTKDYIRIALGPFFSFIIALGLAFFFDNLDHSLQTAAEVEEYLKVPVLGTVSEIQGKK